MLPIDTTPVACSACFSDHGLQLDAEQIGEMILGTCPNCGASDQKKLPIAGLEALAYRFFVWGSLWKARYGAAPLVQFNKHQQTSIHVTPWLSPDIKLFERLLGIGFFHYGPRLWMVGEVEPLKALEKPKTRQMIVKRIIKEYPTRALDLSESFYRVRVNPTSPADPEQYDSPPSTQTGKGRLDSSSLPVLYGSSDLHVCVHECRVTAEDEIYVATINPTRSLHLLDLSILLEEDNVTEFESLDMTVHMLFLAWKTFVQDHSCNCRCRPSSRFRRHRIPFILQPDTAWPDAISNCLWHFTTTHSAAKKI